MEIRGTHESFVFLFDRPWTCKVDPNLEQRHDELKGGETPANFPRMYRLLCGHKAFLCVFVRHTIRFFITS